MSTINQKLGLKPRTRARLATHGKAIRSDQQCPNCGVYQVRESVIKQIVQRRCDQCGFGWRPNGEPAHVYIDGGCLRTHPEHISGCKYATEA